MDRNIVVSIDDRRAVDYTPLYAAGIDVRTFFEIGTADKFFASQLVADKRGRGGATAQAGQPPLAPPIAIFAVLAATREAEKYVRAHVDVFRQQGVLLSALSEYNAVTAVGDRQGGVAGGEEEEAFDGTTFDFRGPADVVVAALLERFSEGIKTTSSPVLGAAAVMTKRDSSLSNGTTGEDGVNGDGSGGGNTHGGARYRELSRRVSIGIRAPEELPCDARFVAEGPLGAVWAFRDPETDAEVTARDVSASLGPESGATTAQSRALIDAQISLGRTCPEILAPTHYTLGTTKGDVAVPVMGLPPCSAITNTTAGSSSRGGSGSSDRGAGGDALQLVFAPKFQVHFDRTFRGDPMPLCVVLQTLHMVLRAVQAAHDEGCLFRSISARTIVFDQDNTPRVLATYVVPMHQRALHLTWLMEEYTAFEGLRNPNDFSVKSDMWSIGALLVRMLTGQRPLAHLAADRAIVLSHIQERYVNQGIESLPVELPQRIPEAVRILVGRLLSLNPERRPSCAEVFDMMSTAQHAATCTANAGVMPPHPLATSSSPSAAAAAAAAATAQSAFSFLTVDAPDRELERANFLLDAISPASAEYCEVEDSLTRALLKASDHHDLELLGAKRIVNRIVRERFNVKKLEIGNPAVGFYGAPQANYGSILRYGVLRSGHRLNPQDMSKWMERGTIGSTKRGIYASKSPTKACTFTQAEPLCEGDTCRLLMCDLALGRAAAWAKGMILRDDDYNSGFHSFDSDNEVYLLDESQMAPAYELTVRMIRRAPLPPSEASGTAHRYCLFKRVLGRGAFGEVHFALQLPESRPVAVKQFLHSRPSEGRSEFEVLTRLRDYRHVVRVFHYGLHGDTPFLVMELLACSIQDLVNNFGAMSEEQVARYVREAAAGLESLRLEGLSHCDIKLSNMMLSFDGVLKLADFGLCRLRSDAAAFCGTVPFMARELFDKAPHSAATDVFALGVSAWVMLMGRMPFAACCAATNNVTAAFQRLAAGELQFPESVSPPLRELLQRCVSDDPSQRPTPLEITRSDALSSPLSARLVPRPGQSGVPHTGSFAASAESASACASPPRVTLQHANSAHDYAAPFLTGSSGSAAHTATTLMGSTEYFSDRCDGSVCTSLRTIESSPPSAMMGGAEEEETVLRRAASGSTWC